MEPNEANFLGLLREAGRWESKGMYEVADIYFKAADRMWEKMEEIMLAEME